MNFLPYHIMEACGPEIWVIFPVIIGLANSLGDRTTFPRVKFIYPATWCPHISLGSCSELLDPCISSAFLILIASQKLAQLRRKPPLPSTQNSVCSHQGPIVKKQGSGKCLEILTKKVKRPTRSHRNPNAVAWSQQRGTFNWTKI